MRPTGSDPGRLAGGSARNPAPVGLPVDSSGPVLIRGFGVWVAVRPVNSSSRIIVSYAAGVVSWMSGFLYMGPHAIPPGVPDFAVPRLGFPVWTLSLALVSFVFDCWQVSQWLPPE